MKKNKSILVNTIATIGSATLTIPGSAQAQQRGTNRPAAVQSQR